jgi:hypothetical protein
MTRKIAQMVLTTLDYPAGHSTTNHTERYVALPRAERAPPFGAADNGGAPNSCAHRTVRLPPMVCLGFGVACGRAVISGWWVARAGQTAWCGRPASTLR